MLKKILLGFVFSVFLLTYASAHTLILNVYRDVDDTITIEGKFDTGASAAGAIVRLESLNTGKVLYEERLPRESEITIEVPDEPYQIVLDGGPGHSAIKKGIPPENGFSKESAEEKKPAISETESLNVPFVVSIGLAFCLLFLTIFINIKNTNKILEAISKHSG